MGTDFARMLYASALGLFALKRWDAAEEATNNALTLRADYPDALCLLALIRWGQGDEEAIDLLKRALSIDPDHVETLFYLAKHRLLERDYGGARELFRRGMQRDGEQMGLLYRSIDTLLVAGSGSLCDELRWLFLDRPFRRERGAYPQWDGTPLMDKTLLIVGEVGYGDLFQTSRYFNAAREWAGGCVVLDCLEPAVGLFRSCGLTDIVTSREGALRMHHPTKQGIPVDVQISAIDLPLLLAPHGVGIPRQMPYLSVPNDVRQRWKKRMETASGGSLKVGLRWAGNPEYAADARRSAHLADMAPLAGVEGVHWFCVQKGQREEEAVAPPVGMPATDLAAELTSFEETAGALANLDVLISTDTSVPHLAAALGIPVWMALDDYPNNRWHVEGETNCWYPTMRLFRQTVRGDWRPVFTRIRKALEDLVHDSFNGTA